MPTVLTNTGGLPYTNQELTESINLLPNKYDRLGRMGLFDVEPIVSTIVQVARINGELSVLATGPRGSTGQPRPRDTSNLLMFQVPHIPHPDSLLAAEIQNMIDLVNRSGGTISFDDELAKRMQRMRDRHDLTHEWMRMAALKGVLVDGAGTTVYNWFTEFNVTKKEVDFALGTAGTDVLAKCNEVVAHVEDNLQGETATGVGALVSPEFFNKLIAHAKVKELYVNYAAAEAIMNPQTDDAGFGIRPRRFAFGNIVFMEHRGSVTTVDATGARTSTRFVAANYGHAFPVGTSDTFKLYHAPADAITEVNQTPTDVIWVSQETMKHGKGVELHSESNPLFMCRRPQVLVEIRSSN